LAATLEALGAIAARCPVVCRLAHDNFRQADQRYQVTAKVTSYNAAVSQECARLGIKCFYPAHALEERGERYVMAPDQLHGDLQTRLASAEVCGDYILSFLSERDLLSAASRPANSQTDPSPKAMQLEEPPEATE
jgi:hypothetical protein